ncbi:MAG TPA: hypothetical protein VI544_00840, partial [Candidatus Nanoarchaeia archaeon]|nr:hypothetical protein [Candidatus Nanoarchaeia archaeon]
TGNEEICPNRSNLILKNKIMQEKSENKTNFIDIQKEGDNYLVCEACGKHMEERGCKLKCPRCGYFRSCSDLF